MILLLLLLPLLGGCERFNALFLEEDLLQRPPAKRCADCHAEIYQEWKKSRHFHAWTSEGFRRDSEDYGKLKCLPCHAPHQVDPENKPVLRAELREEGVNCIACHFKEETKSMHGPLKVWSPPHPSKEDINYTKSSFCAGCHAETYREWKLAKVERTCQSCHMPSLGDRDLIQKFPFYLFHFAKPRNSHEFPSLRAGPKDLEVKLEDGQLLLRNVGIPHNLPTADQGDPRLYLLADITYWDGRKEEVRKLFSPASKTALPYGEPVEISVPPGKVKEAKVRILRKLAWSERKELLVELTLRTPSP